MSMSNKPVKLNTIVNWLDRQLQTKSIKDCSLNGLQVEGKSQVRKIVVAVDAAAETFQAAVCCKADLLIVHHGLFWGQSECITGRLYKRIKLLLDHSIGLYAAHLPLDCHPKWGNNILLAKGLALKNIKPFGDYNGVTIGFGGALDKSSTLVKIVKQLSCLTGHEARSLFFGKKTVKNIAIISGGGGQLFEQACKCGYDTYITGEFLHQDVQSAKELGMNIIVGGHYATETLGVQAIARALTHKFSIKAKFLNCPTGF